ncbi:MAG: sigma 54-interacting transcriptional regulator [Chromatiales bacterium]|jgi:DNA-binding NtrC family response regulator
MQQPRPFEHLTPERYLHLFIEQAGGMAQGVTCSTLEAFIQKIVLNSSEVLEDIYRNSHGIKGTLSMQQFGELLVNLKNTIGGQFEVAQLDDDCLRLTTRKCPFGSSVESAPALCHMTSSIFGGIAARNYGYAKVELKKRIALGSDHCDICIHRNPKNCEDVIGDEYFSDGVKVIAEVRAPSELQKRIEERLHTLWLKDHNQPIDAQLEEPPGLVAHSDAMLSVLKAVETVAPTRVPVLISGETGVGKEVIARAIHAMSPRRDAPFIAVNCGSIPLELVETELFGHEAGAYTDAKNAREGRFERADSGTLFLDEVDSLSPKAQVSLLRVLQEYRFERVGGKKLITCDARVIAATNQDLAKAVEAGRFRRDLFYRLNVVPLYIPPLRERPDDLVPLANQLLERFVHRYQTEKKSLTASAINALHEHDWTGNVRELENVLERSFLFSEDKIIHRIFFDLSPATPAALNAIPNIRDAKKQAADKVECQILQQALQQYSGKVEEVANFLNLSTRAVYQKMQHHGLDSRQYN